MAVKLKIKTGNVEKNHDSFIKVIDVGLIYS